MSKLQSETPPQPAHLATTDAKPMSLWRDMVPGGAYAPLESNIVVDVDTAIVGAGITGVTAAWYLAQTGQKVALLDMGDIGAGETGRTTAHLTILPDGGVQGIRSKHGDAATRQLLEAKREAMDFIGVMSEEMAGAARFRRVPAYLYAEDDAGIAQIEEERAALSALGFGAERLGEAPLPFPTKAALRIEQQAQCEPLGYLAGLMRGITRRNGHVFTNTRVTSVEDGSPCLVHTETGTVRARHLLLTTHTPPNRLAYHAQIFAYRTYALAAYCNALPPPGLYFDTADPYHYTRVQDTPWGDVLIVGGNDHKTGKQDEGRDYHGELAEYTVQRFAVSRVAYRWSGQIMQPADMLPFIGPNSTDKNTLFASGFAGNGITLGTVAGRLLADIVLGRKNRHQQLFSSRRLDVGAQIGQVASENVDIPVHLIGDRLAALAASESDLLPGHGKVVSRGGHAIAIYRDEQGGRHECSAVCPHMGCLVHWNNNERSWDCPCHGSRFSAQGKLLNGPSLADLAPVHSPTSR